MWKFKNMHTKCGQSLLRNQMLPPPLLSLPLKQHLQSLGSLTCPCYKAGACFFLLTAPRCFSPFDRPHLRSSSRQAGLHRHRQEPTVASSTSSFAKNHKGRTQFLQVCQEILRGKAGRSGSTEIRTLCKTKKHRQWVNAACQHSVATGGPRSHNCADSLATASGEQISHEKRL